MSKLVKSKQDHPERKALTADKGLLAFLNWRQEYLAIWYDPVYKQWRGTSSQSLHSVVRSHEFRKMCMNVHAKESPKVETARLHTVAKFLQPADAFGNGPDLLDRNDLKLLLRAMCFSDLQKEWRAGRAPDHMLGFKDLWIDTGVVGIASRGKQAHFQATDYQLLDATKCWVGKPADAVEEVSSEAGQADAITRTRYVKFDTFMSCTDRAKGKTAISSMPKNLLVACIGLVLEWHDPKHFSTTEASSGLIRFWNKLLATGRVHASFLAQPGQVEDSEADDSDGDDVKELGRKFLNEDKSTALVNALIFPVWLHTKCSRNASMPAKPLDLGQTNPFLVLSSAQPSKSKGGSGSYITWQAAERIKPSNEGGCAIMRV